MALRACYAISSTATQLAPYARTMGSPVLIELILPSAYLVLTSHIQMPGKPVNPDSRDQEVHAQPPPPSYLNGTELSQNSSAA
eukprot:3707483-Rhodomonas_salina.2